jgi:Family of unknown function (DUF5683)
LKAGIFIILLIVATRSFAQNPVVSDTAKTVIRSLESDVPTTELEMEAPEHNPTRAALLSAAIPGLGQAYNKKYWKIPLVWAGLGTFGYFIVWNDNQYQFYRRNLIYEIEKDPDYPNETGLDQATLKSTRDRFRRSRDQLALYGMLFYLVQIVDAHVDAHLIEFDVNQDLSVRLEPGYIPLSIGGSQIGMSFKFKFKP